MAEDLPLPRPVFSRATRRGSTTRQLEEIPKIAVRGGDRSDFRRFATVTRRPTPGL